MTPPRFSMPPPAAQPGETGREISFRANLLRVIFGLIGLVLLPVIAPELRQHRWLFAAYLVVALVVQLLIYKDAVNVTVRGIAGGIIDIALLTFFCHRFGSISQLLPYLYVVMAAAYMIALGRRVTYLLVGMSCVAYSGIVIAEATGLLPYGPDAAGWMDEAKPDALSLLGPAALFVFALVITTGVLGQLQTRVRHRELELARMNRELEHLSRHDALTRLYNRRYLLERLEEETERVRRGQRLAILMVDLDGFKNVNDEQGHEEGDHLLYEVASAMQRATRKIDIVARYGGDEFVLLLPDSDLAGATRVAERLVENVRHVGRGAATSRDVTASVGIAIAAGDDTASEILRRADEMAYEAKREGGDRVASEQPARSEAVPVQRA